VIAIMTQYATLKDAATYREITSHGVDPNGGVNIDSLKTSWQYFKDNEADRWFDHRRRRRRSQLRQSGGSRKLGPYRPSAR